MCFCSPTIHVRKAKMVLLDRLFFIFFKGNALDRIIHGGQNRPYFFTKLRSEKNGPCNTNSPRLLVNYWETKLLQQKNVIIHIKLIYIKHIHQKNEVQALSVMINNLKEINRYWVARNSTSFQAHVQCVSLWEQCKIRLK